MCFKYVESINEKEEMKNGITMEEKNKEKLRKTKS